MGDQKHGDAMHHAKGLPAFFAVLDPVLAGEAKRVAETCAATSKAIPSCLRWLERFLVSSQAKRIFMSYL